MKSIEHFITNKLITISGADLRGNRRGLGKRRNNGNSEERRKKKKTTAKAKQKEELQDPLVSDLLKFSSASNRLQNTRR